MTEWTSRGGGGSKMASVAPMLLFPSLTTMETHLKNCRKVPLSVVSRLTILSVIFFRLGLHRNCWRLYRNLFRFLTSLFFWKWHLFAFTFKWGRFFHYLFLFIYFHLWKQSFKLCQILFKIIWNYYSFCRINIYI